MVPQKQRHAHHVLQRHAPLQMLWVQGEGRRPRQPQCAPLHTSALCRSPPTRMLSALQSPWNHPASAATDRTAVHVRWVWLPLAVHPHTRTRRTASTQKLLTRVAWAPSSVVTASHRSCMQCTCKIRILHLVLNGPNETTHACRRSSASTQFRQLCELLALHATLGDTCCIILENGLRHTIVHLQGRTSTGLPGSLFQCPGHHTTEGCLHVQPCPSHCVQPAIGHHWTVLFGAMSSSPCPTPRGLHAQTSLASALVAPPICRASCQKCRGLFTITFAWSFIAIQVSSSEYLLPPNIYKLVPSAAAPCHAL